MGDEYFLDDETLQPILDYNTNEPIPVPRNGLEYCLAYNVRGGIVDILVKECRKRFKVLCSPIPGMPPMNDTDIN